MSRRQVQWRRQLPVVPEVVAVEVVLVAKNDIAYAQQQQVVFEDRQATICFAGRQTEGAAAEAGGQSQGDARKEHEREAVEGSKERPQGDWKGPGENGRPSKGSDT
jgi:hypothetical protein